MSDAEQNPESDEELHAAFSGAYGALDREVQLLRRQVERQAGLLDNIVSRERAHRKLIEDQYQLLQAKDRAPDGQNEAGPLLTIPVHEAMGRASGGPSDPGNAPDGIADWLADGARTDDLLRPGASQQTSATETGNKPSDLPGGHYLTLRRPISQAWRSSPGLAAFSLKRGDLRTLGFNLIGASDDRLDHLAEEIAQSVALNRKFAPVIFTTTRAGLNSFRSRRLTYESLPVFSDTIARISGVADARTFYDLRVGYLVRKWRVQGVMNMGSGYAYSE